RYAFEFNAWLILNPCFLWNNNKSEKTDDQFWETLETTTLKVSKRNVCLAFANHPGVLGSRVYGYRGELLSKIPPSSSSKSGLESDQILYADVPLGRFKSENFYPPQLSGTDEKSLEVTKGKKST